MNRTLTAAATVAVFAGLAACAAPERNTQELSQQTVQYSCGQGSTQPLSVEYTFQGDEPLAATIVYNSQAASLTRVTTSNVDMVGNTFRGNGYTWTTDKFTRSDVGTVDGKMLTREAQQTVNGQTSTVSNVLVKDCRVAGTS